MHSNVETKREFEGLSSPKLRTLRDEQSALEDYDLRLQYLDHRLQDVDSSPRVVWLKNTEHIYDASLDLRVKVEAVRWMLRVAKHLEEPARRRVLATICRSLNQLENAIETEAHAA